MKIAIFKVREIKINLTWNESTACVLPEGWQLRWQAAVWHCGLPCGPHAAFCVVSPDVTGARRADGCACEGGWWGRGQPSRCSVVLRPLGLPLLEI